MKKAPFIIAIILCFSVPANAQFFKNLGDKVVNAAEKTIEKKAEQKTKKETEKAFDSTFNKKQKKRKNKKSKSNNSTSKVDQTKNYAFNHKVVMHMKSGKEEMDMDYYLSNNEDYFGIAIKDKKIKEDFIMVYDIEQETMITFMENGGHKMKMGVNFKTENTEDESPQFEIKATGNTKSILGYTCKEYKMIGEDLTSNVWVTKDIDIRFPSTLYNKDKNNNQEWMKDLDGWAMEMIMIDSSGKKPQTITLNCLSIEKTTFKINANEYQNIGR